MVAGNPFLESIDLSNALSSLWVGRRPMANSQANLRRCRSDAIMAKILQELPMPNCFPGHSSRRALGEREVEFRGQNSSSRKQSRIGLVSSSDELIADPIARFKQGE